MRDENVRESGCAPLDLTRAQHPSPGSHPLKGHPCSALRRRLGAELAAKAPPDGYTLLVANNSLTANFSLFRKLPYDPFKDFVPIALGATSPNMVVVHPSLPARNVKELVALARQRPGLITFASPGPGTPSHLAGELFRVRTGSNMLHVPYKGSGPLMVDQIGGHVVLSFTAPIVSKPHVDAGKLRALAACRT